MYLVGLFIELVTIHGTYIVKYRNTSDGRTDSQCNFVRSSMGLRKCLKQREGKSVSRQRPNKCLLQTSSNVTATSLRGYIPNWISHPKTFQCWTFLLPSENTNKLTYTIREEARWMKMKRALVILKFKIRRRKGIKSEWERTGIKSRNGGYNKLQKECLNNQKQEMKRKNFKKREK